ncbi:MAG: YeeE/YedE family protein, partial [Alcanivoracaceae bacterium]|nr:YeeE/YedE family protein [Alcanivoracaceae bacterium]
QTFATMPVISIEAGYPLLIVAGFLVGISTRYGAGCTSGHGVCGISRFSVRSLAATGAFMATGFATVYVVRHVIGG